MKIIIINTFSNGSTGNISKKIKKALEQNGDECWFFYGIGNSGERRIERIGSNISIHLHSLLSRLTGLQCCFSYFSTLCLIRKIKKIKPDIVHFHNIHGSYLNMATIFNFLAREKIPVVETLHDCWAFTGKCPHFSAVKCMKWKDKCGNCPQLSRYPASSFFDVTAHNIKKKDKLYKKINNFTVTAVSDWLANCARESILRDYNIKTIHNGIDLELFYPDFDVSIFEHYNIPRKKIVLGVASVWSERKGLVKFKEISSLLSDEFAVVIVGLNEDQIASLPKNMIGIKRTENIDDLRKIYSCASVFINTSLEETFGLVTAEALACGTPAIVFNSTACPEVLDSNSGIVLDNSSSESLLRAIYKIVENKTTYSKENCVNRIKNNFSSKKMLQGYLNLYSEILDRRY